MNRFILALMVALITVQGAAAQDAAFTWIPSEPVEGDEVTFTTELSGGSYAWDFEIGNGNGNTAKFTFDLSGVYEVTLTVDGTDYISEVVVEIPEERIYASDPRIGGEDTTDDETNADPDPSVDGTAVEGGGIDWYWAGWAIAFVVVGAGGGGMVYVKRSRDQGKPLFWERNKGMKDTDPGMELEIDEEGETEETPIGDLLGTDPDANPDDEAWFDEEEDHDDDRPATEYTVSEQPAVENVDSLLENPDDGIEAFESLEEIPSTDDDDDGDFDPFTPFDERTEEPEAESEPVAASAPVAAPGSNDDGVGIVPPNNDDPLAGLVDDDEW